MTFTVRRRLLEHDGGTKFYQLFHFNRIDKHKSGLMANCTLTHWGAMKVAKPWPQPRPVNGGQIQHLAGSNPYVEKRAEKEKERPGKGRYVEVGSEAIYRFPTVAEFEQWVTEQIGAEEAHNIFLQMSLRGSERRVTYADDDPVSVADPDDLFKTPSARAKRTPKTAPETVSSPRPEGWGSG